MNDLMIPNLDPADDRFGVTALMEIAAELRAAMAQRSLVTLRYGTENECALTALLEVDPTANTVVLDGFQDAMITRRALAASMLILETEVRRIRVRFDAPRAVAVTHDGRPALKIAFPKRISRIQRREAYRIDMPANEVVACRFPHPKLANREVVLRVADLSVRGMGLAADVGLWPAEPDSIIKACRIDLPEIGVVHGDARVVRVLKNLLAGKCRLVIGCQFVQLTGNGGTLLQKYILQLERTRLARSRGIESGV
jgi:flagellar brake protein